MLFCALHVAPARPGTVCALQAVVAAWLLCSTQVPALVAHAFWAVEVACVVGGYGIGSLLGCPYPWPPPGNYWHRF